MKESTKKVISLALAGTLVTGASATIANAEETNTVSEPEAIVQTSSGDVIYTIKKGETLSGIALMFYGNATYYKELAEFNHIENPDVIFEGQKLIVPRTISNIVVTPEVNPEPVYTDTITHVVNKNDYLISIVRYYYGNKNVMDRVNKLATYNELEDPNLLSVGQVLLIPNVEVLDMIIPNDYTLAYQRLEWRINHPGEEYPEELQTPKELTLKK